MEQLTLFGAIYIAIMLLGFYLAYLYGHRTKNFKWPEYLAIVIWPIIFVLGLIYYFGLRILILFVLSSFAGFFMEYIIGLTYHKTLNKRLWEYRRLSVSGYTSLLSIPLWGVAGVLFWFLSKMVGL